MPPLPKTCLPSVHVVVVLVTEVMMATPYRVSALVRHVLSTPLASTPSVRASLQRVVQVYLCLCGLKEAPLTQRRAPMVSPPSVSRFVHRVGLAPVKSVPLVLIVVANVNCLPTRAALVRRSSAEVPDPVIPVASVRQPDQRLPLRVNPGDPIPVCL